MENVPDMAILMPVQTTTIAGEAAPQRVAGREDDRPVRALNLLHDLIEKSL